jgi:hypothetical protein
MTSRTSSRGEAHAPVTPPAERQGRTPPRVVIASLGLVASLVTIAPFPGATQAGNIVTEWNQAALQAVRESKLAPPVVARALAVINTCIFDAWAAYVRTAVGTRLGSRLRRPAAERTAANKKKAISFAAHRAGVDLFPSSGPIFDKLMTRLGYERLDMTTDSSTPAGVGNLACQAVLEFRHQDGSNQLGELNGGAPYSDSSGYVPVNQPMDIRKPFDPSTVEYADRWQPLRFTDSSGAEVTQKFAAPGWLGVRPFALRSPSQFRSSAGPAAEGSAAYRLQARELIDLSAHLTDRQKAIAEYWADGPGTELPPGHWDLLAQAVSRRDHHTLDQDVKMFFALTNGMFDAGIVAWDNKRRYDSVRPVTAIRYLYNGRKISAWGGPGKGTRLIDGGAWLPYQPTTFPTPPFPEYSSGHSTFSAAAAEILRLFTRSDTFGYSVKVRAGSSRTEPDAGVPAREVTLRWPTFSAAAGEAGLSRRYGGIHFKQGDLDGRHAGKLTGAQAWKRAEGYWKGYSPPSSNSMTTSAPLTIGK